MRCHLCSDDLEHCHEVSIVHTDGFAECGGDEPCPLSHHLHEWRITCAELDPPCPCAGTEELGDGAGDDRDVVALPADRQLLPLAA